MGQTTLIVANMMGISCKKFIKIILLTSISLLLLINVRFLLSNNRMRNSDKLLDYTGNKDLNGFGINSSQENPYVGNVNFINQQNLLNHLSDLKSSGNLSQNASSGHFLPYLSSKKANLTEILRAILLLNRLQYIRNIDKFDLVTSDASIIIVVQVHNRPEYLRHLIDSLRQAEGIELALLIFSHDFYSDELNNIVASVDFCLVIQIFYPYSQQLYPRVFPGEDPKDCPRNVSKKQAMLMGCQNKDYPDKYGHYREAKYTQTKQHWFWKINHVFDRLEVTRNYNGPVLFIEEDHYLVPDFIHILKLMLKFRSKVCTDCSILTLGMYDKKPSYGGNSAKVEVTNWLSSKHNMGMALTRDTWNQIRSCGEAFCSFDDYNWDWSLQYIGMTCIPNKLKVMVMKSPRIYHIGECGLHAKHKNCNPVDRVRYIQSLLSQNIDSLFPASLSASGFPGTLRRVPKPNGGWGDQRDHKLCRSHMTKT